MFVVLVCAAAAGVFGGGPAAHTSTGRVGVSVSYDRFTRDAATLRVNDRATPSGELCVAVDGIFAPNDSVSCSPPPVSVETVAGVRRFKFRTVSGTPLSILFRWAPHRPGLRRGGVTVGDERFRLWIFVYP